jgi:hypothetical protein
MVEKRHSKRLLVDLKLEISSLFKQDNVYVNDINAPIEVINISKDGIGFNTKSVLPLDYYFNAKINLGDEESSLYCVVRIVRKEEMQVNTSLYGAEFVGMPSVLFYIFDEFEERIKNEANE